MSLEPTMEEQELLASSLTREHTTMTMRERISGAIAGGGFIAATAALWALHPPDSFPIGSALLCAIVLVAATMVSFDTPFGFTVLTQVAFIPLLFVVPPAVVPIVVAASLAIVKLPGIVRREIPTARLLGAPGNSWFALGPAAVFAFSETAPADAGAGLLIGALAAEFALDFLVSSLRYSFSWSASLKIQLRETWVYGIDAALSGIGLVVAALMQTHPEAVLALLPLLGLLAVLARERRQRLESLVELNNAYRGTALVLGDVVEADDGYTGEHCKGVVSLSVAVGERLGLSATQRRNLEFAALLHDVGKIAVPKEIVNKPGKLSSEEWTIIKTHSAEGQRMLSRVGGFMRDVGLIVRSHHERWDGRGYPDGLAGEDIPLEARVIACCDSWNAMRTDRVYRI
ncbi:MAG TPA: HD-GYP domain-containing protein, partial [Solirubrobacteraceae bacterium]|nr:HD-GYP domain-containing protein [Solirubrobacteraceae bacterium]